MWRGCPVTSWLTSSPPPLRRAKQRQLLPSRLPSVPSFAARLRLRLPSHILILFPSVTSEEDPRRCTVGTATALKSIVGPMCAGHRGFISTTAGRKSRVPFTSYTLPVPTLASLAFPGSQILQCIVCLLITRQGEAACKLLVIWLYFKTT